MTRNSQSTEVAGKTAAGSITPVWDPEITIEEVTDPVYLERLRQHRERAQKNWDWLAAHQHELLPHGFGKFLAVAGQEAFLADTLFFFQAEDGIRHWSVTGVQTCALPI